MCKKLVFLTIATLVVAPAIVNAASQGPVGWWKFDDGSGTTAVDSAGGRNGALLPAGGEATWAAGKVGGALQFAGGTGTKPYVELPITDLLANLGDSTVTLWVNWAGGSVGSWQRIFDFGAGTTVYGFLTSNAGGATAKPRFAIRNVLVGEQIVSAPSSVNIADNAWHHLGVGMDRKNMRLWLYVDGVPVANAATRLLWKDLALPAPNADGTQQGWQIWIARSQYSNDAYYGGGVDDLRIYDRFLSGDDVMNLLNGGPGFGVANSPSPANKATELLANATTLSWTAGAGAVKHNVYFGTDAANLSSVLKGTTATTYKPSTLALGTTYYWRVDELDVNSVVTAGNVWSFTTELKQYKITSVTAAASSEVKDSEAKKSADNSGIDASDLADTNLKSMWVTAQDPNTPVTIQYTFDKVYKMAEMWVWNYNSEFELDLGYGIKNATVEYSTDGSQWTKLGDFEFAQAIADVGYAHNTTIDFKGVAAKIVKITAKSSWGDMGAFGLSEVRFYSTPSYASAPSPANNATGVAVPTTLTWRPGRTAAQHRVFFGTNQTNVKNGSEAPMVVTTPSFTPEGLQLDGTAYYWRVDEFNPTDTVKTWTGDVWKFTTATSLTVDDMEGYTNDLDYSRAIFQTWIDGYGSTKNGSQVGYRTAPFAETTNVHGGSQSMPFFYTNTKTMTVSEATRAFATPQNWTVGGLTTLTLFFRADVNNTGGQLYIKVNGVKMVYNGSLTVNTIVPLWQQWNISLDDLATLAGDLSAITTMSVGVQGASAKGVLFIDDIRLTKAMPAVSHAKDPGTSGLMAYYKFSDNLKDSSGNGYDGNAVGNPTYSAGLAAFGKALTLNGTTDCVDLGKKDAWIFPGSFTISIWANIGSWATQWGCVMMGNRGEDNKGWQIRRGSGTGVCFTTRGIGNDDTQGGTPPMGQWFNITCVYDNVANTKTIYLNGSANVTQTTNAGAKLAVTTHNTYIGARANGGNTGFESQFTGMLDEIRVFTRALSSDEAYSLAGGK